MGQVADRIIEFLEKKNISDQEFMQKTNISRSTIWRYHNKPGEPELEIVSRVIQNLPINAYWLLTGDERVEMIWKGKADEEIETILKAVSENKYVKKTIYNFIKWQDNIPQKGKEDSK